MNRLFALVAVFLLAGCAAIPPLHKGKLIGVHNLIEMANYDEAKRTVEELVEDKKSSEWPRTWYARGLLAQTAYTDGMKKNNRKMFELYPDQLYVAFESYEKAQTLDNKGSFDRQLAPRYVQLANDFKEMGRRHYTAARYQESLRAFEAALTITESPLLSLNIDTNLIYNASLAAIEGKNHERAISHLSRLDSYSHSANVAHLLFSTYLSRGDTLLAENVLVAGIDKYEDNEGLILLLSDLYFRQAKLDDALTLLDTAIENYPDNHTYPFTKGLILQKTEQYHDAIEAYEQANALNPDNITILTNIATCYYNIGVEIDEVARLLNSNREVMEQKARSAAAFEAAVSWLDKAFELDSTDQTAIISMYQLYRLMNIQEKASILEERINQVINR